MLWPSNKITYLAQTCGRSPHQKFGIKQSDRLSHTYVIGKTGTGKSTLLLNMMMQDVEHGNGFCLIDPHGDLVEQIYENIPKHRKRDIIYLDVPNVHQVYGYNPLRYVKEEKRSLAASGVLEVFKKMWSNSWGVRMEHILRNTILTLLEIPDSNLGDILRLLSDDDFRKRVVGKVTNKQIRYFWEQEFASYSPSFRQTVIAPIQNKVGAFLTDPNVRKVLINPKQDISFRKIMDGRKILLVNLAKGKIGEDATGLLGGLLVTTLGLAAYSRQDIPAHQRLNFFVYMDEFQNFTTLSIANMFSELRKFACGIICACQYQFQIEPSTREAILGNCGTLISFRIGAKDASYIAQELAPKFKPLDLVRLPNYQISLKLMINGTPSRSFSGNTFP